MGSGRRGDLVRVLAITNFSLARTTIGVGNL